MREGKRLLGRQIMYLIDQHFKITEADGAVYDIDYLLSVTMNNDNLQAFLCTWDTVLSGLRAQPDKSMLEALFLRQIRVAKLWNRTFRTTTALPRMTQTGHTITCSAVAAG